MSGPVTSADVEMTAARASSPSGVTDILESRTANVGSIPVRRALPQRARRTVGAWCFFDHGGPLEARAADGGIGPHPHIGLQTVTWMIAGELLHRDSLGTEQTIRPGQLNLTTAGAGIVHAEEHTRGGRLELAQLWIAQPSATKDGPGGFEHHAELPEVDLGGGTATVLIGSLDGAVSRARRDTDHVGVELLVRSQLAVPADRAYEYVVVPMDAPVEVDGRLIEPGQLVYLGPGREELAVRAAEPARVILLGGVPFEEPILMWWNYVARTPEEITVAHADWTQRRDRFRIPASQLAPIDVPLHCGRRRASAVTAHLRPLWVEGGGSSPRVVAPRTSDSPSISSRTSLRRATAGQGPTVRAALHMATRRGSRRARPGRCRPARRCVITNPEGSMTMPPRGDLEAMLAAPTTSRWARSPQWPQTKPRPLGFATRAAQHGQLDEVPRSSTRTTAMPATSALSLSTEMSRPTLQLRTAKF